MAYRFYGVESERRATPVPDYGSHNAFEHSPYGPFRDAPNAYDLNRAYNGRDVTSQYPPSLSSDQPIAQSSPKWKTSKQYKRPYGIIAGVIIVTVCLVVAFCLAFAFAFPSSKDQEVSSRLEDEDPDTAADFTGSVIAEELQWDPEMADTDSSMFKKTASDLERSLDTYYKKSNMSEIYNYSVVTGLRQGSVVCDIRIYLKSLTEEASIGIRYVYDAIKGGQGSQMLAVHLSLGQEAFQAEQKEKAPEDRIRMNTFNIASFQEIVATTTTMVSETTAESATVRTTSDGAKETTSSSSETKLTTTSSGAQETTTSSGIKLTTTSSGAQETTTSSETKLTTTSSGAQETTTNSGIKLTTTSSGAKETTSSGIDLTTTSIGTKETTNSSGIKLTITSSGAKETTASSGIKLTTTSSGAKETTTNSGINLTTTSSGTKETTNSSGIKPTTTSSGVKETSTSSVTVGTTPLSAEALNTTASTRTVASTDVSGGSMQTTSSSETTENMSISPVSDLKAELRQGQLWLWYKNRWNSVCHENFTKDAAEVVCRQLGYKYGYFYEGVESPDMLYFVDLQCDNTSTQTHLSQCYTTVETEFVSSAYSPFQTTNINCFNSENPQFTLSGGDDAAYGYVNVKWDNQEGLLCSTVYYNHYSTLASNLCYDINSTFWGGTPLDSAYEISTPAHANLWQVVAYCSSTDRKSPFNDCVRFGWQFLQYGDYSNSAHDTTLSPPEASTTMRPDIASRTTNLPLDLCIVKLYCYSTSETRLFCGYLISSTVVFPQGPGSSGLVVAGPDFRVFCRDTFSDNEARVLCRTLGLSGGKSFKFNPIPGLGTKYYSRNSFDYKCSGDEMTIDQCTAVDRISSCSGPAVVKCIDPDSKDMEWDVKLASDGWTALIYHNGQWGTICNDAVPQTQWTTREATVVCRMLGFTHGSPQFRHKRPEFSPPHVIRNVTCPEKADSLQGCSYNEVDSDACKDSFAAEVYCYNLTDVPELELVRGSEPNSGLVKVLVNGEEGYLCTKDLSDNAASVMCRQFGFKTGFRDFEPVVQDPDLPAIWQANFAGGCNNQDSIAESCRSSPWVKYNADLDQAQKNKVCNGGYVHLYCLGTVTLKLFDGSASPRQSSGILTTLNPSDFRYYALCQTNLTQSVADAACREFSGKNEAKAGILASGTYPLTYGAKNVEFTCAAGAMSISECIRVYQRNGSCPEAQLTCYDDGHVGQDPTPDALTEWRLNNALVEVKAQDLWSQVCIEGWTDAESTVLCKSLDSNYTLGYATSTIRSYMLPLWLTSVQCDSADENISSCTMKTIEDGTNVCESDNIWQYAAQTYCYRGESDIPRLTLVDVQKGGYFEYGHLAINISGQNGYYCPKRYTGSIDADKACRSMGYYGGMTTYGSKFTVSTFEYNSVWNGSLDCDWQNSRCHFNGHFVEGMDNGSSANGGTSAEGNSWDEKNGLCDEKPDNILCFTWKVRLSEPTSSEGEFLIQDSDGWYTICGLNFLDYIADKFCREAGYSSGTYREEYFSATYSQKYSDMSCPSEDINFKNCTYEEGMCENSAYVECSD